MSKPSPQSPTTSWRVVRSEGIYKQLRNAFGLDDDQEDHGAAGSPAQFDHDNIDALIKLLNDAAAKGIGDKGELAGAINGIAHAKAAVSLQDVIEDLIPVRDYVDSVNHHHDHARFAGLVKSINDNYGSLLDDIAEHGGAVEMLEPL